MSEAQENRNPLLSSVADDTTITKQKNAVPTITDTTQLLQYGICRVPFFESSAEYNNNDNHNHNNSKEQDVLENGPPQHVSSSTSPYPIEEWITRFTTVSPYQQMMEGDFEYALYRNIMDEEDFPFLELYKLFTPTLRDYFGIGRPSELELDDAFCVHYNMDQYDTSGAKHMDPSDITINICLECTFDVQGSQVKFYGTPPLLLRIHKDNNGEENDVEEEHTATTTTAITNTSASSISLSPIPPTLQTQEEDDEFQFLVEQVQGYATVHWGHHAHQTMPLTHGGRRTNLILTYRYTDPNKRQTVALRTCYGGP